jgi:hypothetical protein
VRSKGPPAASRECGCSLLKPKAVRRIDAVDRPWQSATIMSETFPDTDWLEADDLDPDADDMPIGEYDLTATPNDFNIKTIVDFLKRGVFQIPGFQRNYVWDIRRASKLIESLLMGLPVPQIFLYEQERNKFLVIDGQQRLLSLFYFSVKRFPKIEKRSSLRRIVTEHTQLPAEYLSDDEYFTNFNLKLPSKLPTIRSRFDTLNYDTLAADQITFDLRTIRCVVIKQNQPDNDDSSVYEIFHRLNTGGVNLTPQEIRTSLYNSEFYMMLYRLNALPAWRKVIGLSEPDLRMRDVEILLRGYAMLIDGGNYRPSMTRFLNAFSKAMRRKTAEELQHLEALFVSFLNASESLPEGVFGTRSRKLNVSVFESVFTAAAEPMYKKAAAEVATLDLERIDKLKTDREFVDAASTKSTDKNKVATRLRKARSVLAGGA